MASETEPRKFKKKPVAIEAMQYTGTRENVDAIFAWSGPGLIWNKCSDPAAGLCIHTLEGTMTALPGDWIIKGIKGEFYPCKPDIFEGSYEPVA